MQFQKANKEEAKGDRQAKSQLLWFFQRDVWMIVWEGESCSLSKSFTSTSIARYR